MRVKSVARGIVSLRYRADSGVDACRRTGSAADADADYESCFATRSVARCDCAGAGEQDSHTAAGAVRLDGNGEEEREAPLCVSGDLGRDGAALFSLALSRGQCAARATLYIAGPRSVSVWVNGQPAEKVASDTARRWACMCLRLRWRGPHAGDNVIAIEAVRGRGVTGFANSALVQQQTSGRYWWRRLFHARRSRSSGPDAQRAGVAQFDDC